MFTGIVEEVGEVISIDRVGDAFGLTIRAKRVMEDLKPGDSVSVSGACLTATGTTSATFTVDVSPETLRVTTLGGLGPGARVNLERSLRVGDRMGGHMVMGHVDGVGKVMEVSPQGNTTIYRISAPENVLRYAVSRGSIALDGISLTIVSCDDKSFTVSVIPFTARETTISNKRAGDLVNLEADLMGKYVERFLKGKGEGEPGGKIDERFLAEHGYI